MANEKVSARELARLMAYAVMVFDETTLVDTAPIAKVKQIIGTFGDKEKVTTSVKGGVMYDQEIAQKLYSLVHAKVCDEFGFNILARNKTFKEKTFEKADKYSKSNSVLTYKYVKSLYDEQEIAMIKPYYDKKFFLIDLASHSQDKHNSLMFSYMSDIVGGVLDYENDKAFDELFNIQEGKYVDLEKAINSQVGDKEYNFYQKLSNVIKMASIVPCCSLDFVINGTNSNNKEMREKNGCKITDDSVVVKFDGFYNNEEVIIPIEYGIRQSSKLSDVDDAMNRIVSVGNKIFLNANKEDSDDANLIFRSFKHIKDSMLPYNLYYSHTGAENIKLMEDTLDKLDVSQKTDGNLKFVASLLDAKNNYAGFLGIPTEFMIDNERRLVEESNFYHYYNGTKEYNDNLRDTRHKGKINYVWLTDTMVGAEKAMQHDYFKADKDNAKDSEKIISKLMGQTDDLRKTIIKEMISGVEWEDGFLSRLMTKEQRDMCMYGDKADTMSQQEKNEFDDYCKYNPFQFGIDDEENPEDTEDDFGEDADDDFDDGEGDEKDY